MRARVGGSGSARSLGRRSWADGRRSSGQQRTFLARFAQSVRGEGVEPTRQGDLHAVGEEGDEDVRFDSAFVMMEDWTNRQVSLQSFERFLHGDELNVVLP